MNHVLEYVQASYLVTPGSKGADLNFPEAQEYLHSQVCVQNYLDEHAIRAYYMSKFRIRYDQAFDPKTDAYTTAGLMKMREGACK